MNKLIYSEDEMNKFLSIMPELQDDEVYFIALFQRNKHISHEDRVEKGLVRCSVLSKVICRSKESIVKNLYRWEANPKGFVTTKNQEVPNECLVPYITVQPISTIKAYVEFNKIVTDYLVELGNHRGPKENKLNTYDRIKKLNSLLLDCHQHAYSRKVFIDIDFDGDKNWNGFAVFKDKLRNSGIIFHEIETAGGFHLLLDKSSIKNNYNLLVKEVQDKLIEDSIEGEVEISNNQAIPVPGCYQYGNFEVRLKETTYVTSEV